MRKEADILAAIEALLGGLGANAVRNPESPVDIAAGDVVIVMRDGDPGEPDAEISGGSETYAHLVPVEVYACAATETARATLLDAALRALGAALAGAGTLGGLAEDLAAEAPREPEQIAVLGAALVKARVVPLIVTYSVDDPLG